MHKYELIDLSGTAPVTDQYLDDKYLEIYRMRYGDLDCTDIDDVISTFIGNLCTYLQQGPGGIPTIEKATMRVLDQVSPITMYLTICGNQFQLPSMQYVTVRMMSYQDVGNPSPWYEIPSRPNNNYYGGVCGAYRLVPEIHKVLGYDDCHGCYYSDSSGKHCGIGMEMYTNDCSHKLRGKYG